MFQFAAAHFLVPPGLFVALLLLAALRRLGPGKSGSGSFAFFALLIWGCSCAPAADFLAGRLEQGLRIPESPRGDVIVVLGGGVHSGVPDLSGVGVPGEEAMARLVGGARLYRRLGIPVIVSGGVTAEGRQPEAPVMKRILVDLGVPAERVAVEGGSRDTRGNAAGTARVMDERGYRTAILVTSAYHMKRALFLFERQGVKAVPVPVQFRSRPGRTYAWQDWMPSAGSMHAVASACKEYLGTAWYRITPGVPDPGEGKEPS